MSYCNKCGVKNKDDARFCTKCGNNLGKVNSFEDNIEEFFEQFGKKAEKFDKHIEKKLRHLRNQ